MKIAPTPTEDQPQQKMRSAETMRTQSGADHVIAEVLQ